MRQVFAFERPLKSDYESWADSGLPSRAATEAFLAAGFSERQILEIVLALAVKTISNYSNHLFHTALDPVFAGRQWSDKA